MVSLIKLYYSQTNSQNNSQITKYSWPSRYIQKHILRGKLDNNNKLSIKLLTIRHMGNQPLSIEAKGQTKMLTPALRTQQRSSKQQQTVFELICSEQYYQNWKKQLQSFMYQINNTKQSRIKNRLLLPLSYTYHQNYNLCSSDNGKATIQYESKYIRLTDCIQSHLMKNIPFTTSQLWNLLFNLTQIITLFRSNPEIINLQAQNIYVDSHIRHIKIATMHSFIGGLPKQKHEKYIDEQKLQLMIRKYNIPGEVERRNDDFAVGMILTECLMMEQCILLYEEGLSHHKTINHIVHQHLVQNIMKISYYPIKLRVIISSMIQLKSEERFTCQEVAGLLQPFSTMIHKFQHFHIDKNMFTNIFQNKMKAVNQIVDKLKQESQAQLFRSGLINTCSQLTNKNKNGQIIGPSNSTKYNNRINKVNLVTQNIENPKHSHNHHTHNNHYAHNNHNNHHHAQSLNLSLSLNISLTNPPKSSKGIQFQQLSLSRSEINGSMTPNQNDLQRELFHKKLSAFDLSECNKAVNQISQKQNLKDHFDPFEEFASEQSQHLSHSSLNRTIQGHISKKIIIQQLQPLSNSHQQKDQQQLSSNNQENSKHQSIIEDQEKIQIQNQYTNQEAQAIMDQPQKIEQEEPLQSGKSSSVSQVVQYMSQLYEASPNQMEQSQVSESNQTNLQKNKNQFDFETLKQNQTKPLKVDNISQSLKVVEQQFSGRSVKHQNSIINQLDPLLSSKKILNADDHPPKDKNLIQTSNKMMEYLSIFKKYSPQTIAQLNLASNFPENQRLKRSMRESIIAHQQAMNKTRQLYKQQSIVDQIQIDNS